MTSDQIRPRRAVVLTAGYGSRFFPVTSVVPKSLLPILHRPVLHFLLADLAAFGITDIALVVNRGEDAIQRYVTGAPDVQRTLRARGWNAKADSLEASRAAFAGIQFTFLEQDLTGTDYGTAVPARLAADFVGDEPCFHLSGDDLLTHDGRVDPSDLEDLWRASSGFAAAMQVVEVDPARARRYGTVRTHEIDGRRRLAGLVEKDPDTISSLANISRYVFSPAGFGAVLDVTADSDSGEFLITDALTRLIDGGGVGISTAAGRYYDCGSVDGWLSANQEMAHHPS